MKEETSVSYFKIGILGTGGMGKTHAHCLMRNPFCKVIAASSKTARNLQRFVTGKWQEVAYGEKLGDFSPLYPIQKAYRKWEELISDPEIDAVVIASPNALHYPQAKLALQKKKHLLIEKPATINLQELRHLLALAQKSGSVAAVAQCWRFHPEVEEAKAILQKKLIGKVVKVKCYGVHILWGPGGWFRNPELAGGGALLDMGVHGIDTVRYILGEPKAKRVSAYLSSVFKPSKQKSSAKKPLFIDDLGILLIEFENNIPCIVESGWNHPYAEGGEATTIILGTKGYVRIFPFEAGFIKEGKIVPISPSSSLAFTPEKLYQRQIDHFVELMRKKEKNNRIPLSIALETMKIMEGAYKASQLKKTILL